MSADDRTRASLEELASRYGLGWRERDQLGSLLALLARDPRAPTSVRDPELGIGVHLADSLAALGVEAVRDAKTLADVGSGAGFPGLPLAVARGGCKVRLIESQSRKC
ncbi:MAG TPA: RsmG family class I SAM-dependent methyltransferase, partial [Solirubrobacteraceae bacterium]|nr:RsmG family class I SAM-dependent methyltransferase [Solirubrobacteraceae bacterium]